LLHEGRRVDGLVLSGASCSLLSRIRHLKLFTLI
jgi:hypothetical protein